LQDMAFKTLVIARPSMLAGNREALNQPSRAGERIGLALTQLLKPVIPANYRSIAAEDVARALTRTVKTAGTGTYRLLSGEMQGAAARN